MALIDEAEVPYIEDRLHRIEQSNIYIAEFSQETRKIVRDIEMAEQRFEKLVMTLNGRLEALEQQVAVIQGRILGGASTTV